MRNPDILQDEFFKRLKEAQSPPLDELKQIVEEIDMEFSKYTADQNIKLIILFVLSKHDDVFPKYKEFFTYFIKLYEKYIKFMGSENLGNLIINFLELNPEY